MLARREATFAAFKLALGVLNDMQHLDIASAWFI